VLKCGEKQLATHHLLAAVLRTLVFDVSEFGVVVLAYDNSGYSNCWIAGAVVHYPARLRTSFVFLQSPRE
jgi:hypothetical protein